MATTYDRAYFDKWYRSATHRVKSPLDIRRQARFIVAATEYLLERPVRRILDVGAGEGNWRAPLLKAAPGATYLGLDSSAYAVQRFGKRRNIRLASFGSLGSKSIGREFDLICCCGVLMYVPPVELHAGLRELARLASGVVYLEVFTSADRADGDFDRASARSPAWWERTIRGAGFVACGMHLYVPTRLGYLRAALERGRF